MRFPCRLAFLPSVATPAASYLICTMRKLLKRVKCSAPFGA
jgi:hypothetical protein